MGYKWFPEIIKMWDFNWMQHCNKKFLVWLLGLWFRRKDCCRYYKLMVINGYNVLNCLMSGSESRESKSCCFYVYFTIEIVDLIWIVFLYRQWKSFYVLSLAGRQSVSRGWKQPGAVLSRNILRGRQVRDTVKRKPANKYLKMSGLMEYEHHAS